MSDPATAFVTCDDGTDLAWTSDGSGDPVLLIQGQATPAAGWRPVVATLSAMYRVIRFEQRGIGASGTGAAERFTTREFARDAVAVLDAAGVAHAHVIGHSMGGKIAQWIAIDAPARVRSMVLLATSGGPDRDPEVARAKRILLHGSTAQREALFFSPEWAAAHRSDVDLFFTLRAEPSTLARIYAASSDHDALEELDVIRTPTLIIGGGADRLVSLAAVRRLADGIPGADLRIVEHARHGLHLADHEVRRLQLEFLRGPQRA